MPFFSVIVPCCDVETYIPETLASLNAQTFRDFETILVVEDSRDRTLELCRKAQAENPRIKVFTQPRSGSPAAPRNTGLAHAEGRYTVFLDGDDLLEHDALQILAAAIQDAGSPDAVQIACQEFLTGPDGTRTMRKRFFNYLPEDHGKIFSGPEATCRVAALHAYPFPITQISICRKEFLSGHRLTQCPGLLHEDEEWTPRILFLAKSVLALDRALYLYRIRPDSIMGCYTALPDPTPYGTVLRLLLKFAMSQKMSGSHGRRSGSPHFSAQCSFRKTGDSSPLPCGTVPSMLFWRTTAQQTFADFSSARHCRNALRYALFCSAASAAGLSCFCPQAGTSASSIIRLP